MLCGRPYTCQGQNTGAILGWMDAPPESLSFAPELPLKFVGGDSSLDLVNTVDWTAAGPVKERLADYQRVVTWAKGSGVINRSEAEDLSRAARDRPRAAQNAYLRARWGRWVLQRLFTSLAQGRPSSLALDEFNGLRREAAAHLALVLSARSAEPLEWRASRSDDLDLVLWRVMRAAELLLTSEDVARLRVCAGPDCGWIYVDRSRNGLRRWCEMQTCGTQEKSRRRTARRRTADAG
jgi:predicted RNA-binding Zn ribbon-like protein